MWGRRENAMPEMRAKADPNPSHIRTLCHKAKLLEGTSSTVRGAGMVWELGGRREYYSVLRRVDNFNR